jgi:hypothetical protein
VIKECLGNSITRRSSDFCESVDGGGTHAGIVIDESIDERRDSVLGGRRGDRAQCLGSYLPVRVGQSIKRYRRRAAATRRRYAAESAGTNFRTWVTGGMDQGLPGFARVAKQKGGRLRAYGRIIVGKQRFLGKRAGAREDRKRQPANRGVTVGKALPRAPNGGGAAQPVERFERLRSNVCVWIVERQKESSRRGFELEVS